MADEHSLHSSQRENTLEHIFIGDVMRTLWVSGVYDLEVLKPEVDDSGYDIVFETRSIVRHIQLKSTKRGSHVSSVNVQLQLGNKPNGCIIIIEFDDKLNLGPFYWFGNPPGQSMPVISSYPIAKQTKGNAMGNKSQRPNIRKIPRKSFQELDSIDEVIECLFGKYARI